MKNSATLMILVQDMLLRPYEKAEAHVRSLGGRRWLAISYDDKLRRYVKVVEPGRYELRIRGEPGWAEDLRTVTLHPGRNSLFSALAPEGMPYYAGVDGEKVYFEPDAGRLLLHVQGQDLHAKLPGLVEQVGLKLGESLAAPGRKAQPDRATFPIELPGPPDERKETLARLRAVVEELLPQAGLSGRLAAPMLRGEGVVEGLTNELIVKFRPEVTEPEAAAIADKFGFRVVRRVTYLGNAYVWARDTVPGYELLDVARALMDEFPVLYAEANLLLQFEEDVFNPDDYLYPEQPHLQVIHADDAWDTLDDIDVNLRAGSPGVTVAVCDGEGISPNHPDLTGNLTDGTAKMVSDFDFVHWVNQAVAGLSGEHGTQCASSAVGRSNNAIGSAGLAGNCHLIGLRRGSTVLDIVDSWIWAAGFPTGSVNPAFPAQLATGADVLSCSWGGGYAWTNTFRDGLDFLTVYGRGGKGCVVCFSVGNLGYVSFSATRRMAAYERTIAVGASINANPTNPCDSGHADPAGNFNNLPAVVDTRAYYNPFGPEMDIVAPSHTSYDPALPIAGAQIRDPIMAAVRVDEGDWPGDHTAQTTLTGAEAAGSTSIQVVSSAGFNVGEYALFGGPGATPNETKRITAVAAGRITVEALEHAYAAGTIVVTGPNDYARNANVGFGGTSHSCPTIAGAAALILSVRPELTWVQVREILRTTAERIDAGQADPTGQWVDNDGDGVDEFSQWYGYGRLDVNAAVIAARDLGAVPDVVVRDNLEDDGTVPSGGWHADSPDIWVRRADDPIPVLAYDAAPPHESPLRGQDNHVYLRVKNVGGAATNEVYLRALITHYPGFEFRYPQEWQPSTRPGAAAPVPLVPGTYLIGEVRIDGLAAGADTIVKMTWDADLIPPANVMVGGVNVEWHPCILAEVSPPDGPAPAGATFDVKRDNNLAHKNIRIEDPGDAGDAFAVGVAAGTSDAVGIEAVLIDRSLVPAGYQVFVRIADEGIMGKWRELAKAGMLVGAGSLPGATLPGGLPEKGCTVRLLDPARIEADCCDCGTLLIAAPRGTRLEFRCRKGAEDPGPPKVAPGAHEGQEVIFFEGGSKVLELPLRLKAGEFLPIAVGLIRPQGKRGGATLKATQRRGDGELSPGYSIEG